MRKRANGNSEGTLITIQQGCEKYNMCRNTLLKIAEELDAVYRFGSRMVRIDTEKLNKGIREQYGGN